MGKPTNIRMRPEDQDFAVRLGDQSLAEGIRRALAIARDAVEGGQTNKLRGVLLPRDMVDQVSALAGGDLARGLGILLKAANVLGRDAVMRLGKGGG